MNDAVRKLKKLADLAPLPVGVLANGDLAAGIGAKNVVVIAIDNRGRIFQVDDGTISGASFRLLKNPVRSINDLMAKWGCTDDRLDWNSLDE